MNGADDRLTAAVQKLRAKVDAGKLSLHLLPEKFTLTQLQKTIEAILGREVPSCILVW